MDERQWESDVADRAHADIQFTRMLHAETQRQLTKLTQALTDVEARLREIENIKNFREGQVVLSGSLGNAALKIGLVVLAFSLGVWGSQMFPAVGERQRSPEQPEYHIPYHRRPLRDYSDEQSNRE